jgi:hypothetical protein
MAAPAGDLLGPVEACGETTCAGPCAHGCGDLLPLTPPSSAIACMRCVAQQCCPTATTCGSSAECRAALECARASTQPDQVNTCTGARHPSGAADFTDLDTCIQTGCYEECAYGDDWTCLGAPGNPRASAATITGTLTVVDGSAQNAGVAGLHVRGCSITDEMCMNPVTPTATTDANGRVTLALPTGAVSGTVGFLGYFEVSDPKGVYLTDVAIPGFSVTQTGFTQSFLVVTLDEIKSLATAIGETYDSTTGSVVATATDCAYHTTHGATFKVDNADSRTILLYPAHGIPTKSTKSTDSTGVVLGAFLPPGAGQVTVTNSAGRVTSKTQFFTRAGAVTVLLASANQ